MTQGKLFMNHRKYIGHRCIKKMHIHICTWIQNFKKYHLQAWRETMRCTLIIGSAPQKLLKSLIDIHQFGLLWITRLRNSFNPV